MSGKEVRLSEFLNPETQRTALLEVDYGLMTGHFEGELNLNSVMSEAVKTGVDGVIASRGFVKRFTKFFLGKKAPSFLLRADWTTLWRGREHPLPAVSTRHMALTDAKDALLSGASGVVAYLFVGYEKDVDEARNLEAIAELARQCDEWGLPLIVEAIPIGDRVLKENYLDAVGLAMRMAVEAGATCVAVPYPGDKKSLKFLVNSCQVPLLILELDGKVSRWQPNYEALGIASEALEAGASGFIVGKNFILKPGFEERLKKLVKLVHEV